VSGRYDRTVALVNDCFKMLFILVAVLNCNLGHNQVLIMKIHLSFLLCNRWLLTFTLFAAIIQTTFAVDPIKEDPKFKAIVERFQTDFGATIKLAQSKDDVVATNYEVRVLEPAQLENAIKVLTWLETEYKRFPAGFFKKHGSKNLVLANAYVSKTWKGPGVPYSPTTIAEKRSNSILVTVPITFTPSSEFLAKSSIYHTVITYLLDDLKSPDSPLALAKWKALESKDLENESESAKRLLKNSNSREGLFKILWDPFELREMIELAKSDPLLKQRIKIVQAFLSTLDPQFNQAFWENLETIPESQRTISLNNPEDIKNIEQIKSDKAIQSDLSFIEKKWSLKVVWKPGSEVPPMPAKVRLEYSYHTDKKLQSFKDFVHLLREELELYPDEIVSKLNVKNIYILDDFVFRNVKVAGQSFSWLPQVSFAYAISSFDPMKSSSRDFYRRTIHHEIFHLMDSKFSVKGGPIHGTNWTDLNEKGFRFKLDYSPADQPFFTKDNAGRLGFAEPYGMNVATDDRATLYGRLMAEDKLFFERLKTDKILKAKTDRILEFFQFIKRDLGIKSTSPFFIKIEGLFPVKKES